MSPLLATLLQALPSYSANNPLPSVEITQVTADSRQVRPGALFVAVQGGATDGHHFIADAVRRGAAAVVGTRHMAEITTSRVPYIRVADSRAALAALAAALHGFPSRRLRLVGVTGTDGKTTTVNLLYHLLAAAGHQPGMISTVSARIGQEELDTGFHVTTPDAPDVQRYLAQMVHAGCDTAILEATSHGLHQGRVAACDFDVAVVTNVSHEHLDYHGSWQAYLDAKSLLFRSLSQTERKANQPKGAVLNADDPSYRQLRAIEADRYLSYGLEAASADLRAEQIALDARGARFLAHTPAGSFWLRTRLVGLFNIYNVLAALAAGLALGLSPQQMAPALADIPGIDGRMERIERGQDFLVIVDFAHTPMSLKRSLEAVRSMTQGRVIVVFGSAGLRDVQKRTLMPEIALHLADYAILTAEDPRSESLEAILAQMAQAARQAGGREGREFERIPDRTAAIQRAIEIARPGDAVIVCGKGHERSMCFGAIEYPWRDQEVVAWALDQRLGRSAGPPPFVLPSASSPAA